MLNMSSLIPASADESASMPVSVTTSFLDDLVRVSHQDISATLVERVREICAESWFHVAGLILCPR